MRILIDTDLDNTLIKYDVKNQRLFHLSQEVVSGNHDGELVTNLLFKKRIPIQHKGGRDGLRGVIAHRRKGNLYWIDVYHKNALPKKNRKERKDSKEIPTVRLKIYKELAREYLAAENDGINVMIAENEFREVDCND